MKGIALPTLAIIVVAGLLVVYAGQYFIGTANLASFLHSAGIITDIGGGSCSPGSQIAFDSHPYLNCGSCDQARYSTTIKGYVIKVFNPTGNMVQESNLPAGTGSTNLLCNQYANIYYPYTVPLDAQSGTWRITLEMAVPPSNPFGGYGDCVVALDQGTWTVGSTCPNYASLEKYCYSENVAHYKPANSCKTTDVICSEQFGAGYRCDYSTGGCAKIEICGDGICDDYENQKGGSFYCYKDCGRCGDNICSTPDETPTNCPSDCSSCGDGKCDSREELYCPKDCAAKLCGNNICDSWEKSCVDKLFCEFKCDKDCKQESTCDFACNLTNLLVAFFLGFIITGILVVLGFIFPPLGLLTSRLRNWKTFLIVSVVIGIFILIIFASLVLSVKGMIM